MKITSAWIGPMAAGWFSLTALAQGTAAPAPQPASQPNATPLSGPKVDEATAKPTLVRYDMSNRLKRLDVPAEEAALELMRLSDQEKAEVERVLAARAEIVDRVVGDNLPLLLRVQLAKEANDTKGLREELRTLFDKFAALRARGSLKDEVAYVLEDNHAAEFKGLVDGYWNAVVRDELKAKQADAGAAERGRAIVVREMLLAFGQEIRRSYERQIQLKTAQLESFIADANATPEQGEQIRKITADAYQASGGKPTLQQRRETFGKVMRVLTPEQRTAVLQKLYTPAPAEAPATAPAAASPASPGGK